MFNFNDVYPGTMGKSVSDVATITPEDNKALGTADVAPAPVDKSKNYNIVSALVALVVVMILLQLA